MTRQNVITRSIEMQSHREARLPEREMQRCYLSAAESVMLTGQAGASDRAAYSAQ